ncbi:MAG: hypothetical protein ACR2RL_20995 [Gammaproteobacteria bacterium]
MESWAADLAQVSAIYPWQGGEKIMVLVAVIAWVVWHVMQLRVEKREFEEDVAKYGSPEAIKKTLDTQL